MTDFDKFHEYLLRLRSSYFRALCSYKVYDELEKLRSANIVGVKQARENLETINRFKEFFHVALDSTRVNFYMGLARLLDDDLDSLHINKLICFVNSNKKRLNTEEFKKRNVDRPYISDLVNRFEGMTQKDVKRIKIILSE